MFVLSRRSLSQFLSPSPPPALLSSRLYGAFCEAGFCVCVCVCVCGWFFLLLFVRAHVHVFS